MPRKWNRTRFAILLLVASPAAGCATTAAPTAWPSSSALGSDLNAYRPTHATSSSGGQRRFKEPTGTLTLGQALAAALLRNPRLRATAWAVRAREADRLQARLLPNPELEVTVEDFGVSGDLRGIREMGLTFAVRQVIWLGGQRARRSRLAARQSRDAGWRYELERLMVLTRTVQSFIAVVTAQRLVSLVRQEETLGRKVVQLFRERSKAGRIARRDLGLIRAEIRLSRTGLKRLQMQRQLVVARQKLAAQWGGLKPRFHQAAGQLNGRAPLPDLEGLLTRTLKSPRVRAWQARVATRQAAVVLAKAGAIPSLTVTGGARVLPDSNSLGFLVGISIPLPFFDRNQGATRAARFRVVETRERLRGARVRIAALVTGAHGNVAASRGTLDRIDKLILPMAQTAVTVAVDAYREGKAGYLAVLDAQRTLVQLGVERLTAQAGLLMSLAELELLLGEPLRAKSNGKHP
jgi:outer membrane protein, heavy metal efflux system